MSYDEIFERVSKLVENVSVKSASTKRAAESDSTEEYCVWSEVDPKDKKFLKAVDQLLSESVPASPTNTDEAEPGTEEELREAYPASNVSSAGEGDVSAEVESAIQGAEEIKESTLKRASDYELSRAFNALTRSVVSYIAAQDSTVKNAALNDVDSISAVCVADLVKQAEFDASLVFGYLGSIKSAMEDEDKSAMEDEEGADKEDASGQSDADLVSDEMARSVEDAAGQISDIIDSAQNDPQAMQQIEELIKSVPEEELDNVIAAIVEENPDAALQAVKENPEVADALIDALSNAGDVDASALKGTLEKEEAKEGPMEDEEEPEGVQKLEEELDTEKHGAFAQLKALDDVMVELGVTPEDIEVSVAGTPREEEGVKLAAAVREFRRKPASKLATSDHKLRVGFKKYLRDLMFGS